MKDHSDWLNCFCLLYRTSASEMHHCYYVQKLCMGDLRRPNASWILKRNINGLGKKIGWLWSSILCLPSSAKTFFSLAYPSVSWCWLIKQCFAQHCHKLQGKDAIHKSIEDRRNKLCVVFQWSYKETKKENKT